MTIKPDTVSVADGINDEFSIPFEFQKREDLVVTVDGVPENFSLIDNNTVRVIPVPPFGAVVRRKRQTLQDLRVNLFRNPPVTQRELALAFQQILFIAQEAFEQAGAIPVGEKGEPFSDNEFFSDGFGWVPVSS